VLFNTIVTSRPDSSILLIPLFSKFLYSPNSSILQIPLISKFLYNQTFILKKIPPQGREPPHTKLNSIATRALAHAFLPPSGRPSLRAVPQAI
jgi:hypothetical protein